jgi:uroporphyrin-III C-methyltransferase/precorrin-2 dehydrogenase/sirohydrochlorin ferrochelatase
MEYLPIFLKLEGRLTVVVGGGEVAARKVDLLRRAGAAVRVVAPVLGDELRDLVAAKAVEHRAGRFEPNDLDGAELVIAATDIRAVNADVAAAARLRHLPVNVVDDPELCGFIMPAIVDRGRIVAAISTGGASPVLARFIRARLEMALPPGIERLAELAAAWRERVKAALPDGTTRRRFWERVLGRAMAGETPDLEKLLTTGQGPAGRVVSIAVPLHDPEALTLRAVRLLQSADTVLHHPAIPPAILEFARRDAKRLVGTTVPEAADGLVVLLVPAESQPMVVDCRWLKRSIGKSPRGRRVPLRPSRHERS